MDSIAQGPAYEMHITGMVIIGIVSEVSKLKDWNFGDTLEKGPKSGI